MKANLWLFVVAVVGSALLATALPVGCNPDTPVPDFLVSECLDCDGFELDRCSDGQDNDEDGLTDCSDPDCVAAYICTAVGPEDNKEWCEDGFDNDGNGFTDCGDFSCRDTFACKTEVQEPSETTDAQCSDGLDNDWNGFLDCGDFSCGAAKGCEGSDDNCSDGIDNDGNGFTDCADFSCSQNNSVTICN